MDANTSASFNTTHGCCATTTGFSAAIPTGAVTPGAITTGFSGALEADDISRAGHRRAALHADWAHGTTMHRQGPERDARLGPAWPSADSTAQEAVGVHGAASCATGAARFVANIPAEGGADGYVAVNGARKRRHRARAQLQLETTDERRRGSRGTADSGAAM